MIQCKNCAEEFNGNFCPNCSQSSQTHRFTLGHLAHEVVHSVSHLDTGIVYLIKELAYRPGFVAAEYIRGRRKRYFNPITLLLMFLALQVIVSNSTNIYVAYQRKINAASLAMVSQLPHKSPEAREKAIKELKVDLSRSEPYIQKVVNSSKLVNLCFLPFLSLLTWLFFSKSGYNYAENLILNIFIAAGILIYFFLLCVPLYLFFPSAVSWIMSFYLVLSVGYSIIAYRQLFKSTAIVAIFKGVTIQLISIMTVGALTPLILGLFF